MREKFVTVHKVLHIYAFKIIPTFAETTAKKKIDEAKQGAFNQIIRNPLFLSILRNIYLYLLSLNIFLGQPYLSYCAWQ